jgi:hypothetical protein
MGYDQIIEAIWALGWYESAGVYVMAAFIMVCKLWWIFLPIMVVLLFSTIKINFKYGQ